MSNYDLVKDIMIDYDQKKLLCEIKNKADKTHTVEIVDYTLNRFDEQTVDFIKREFLKIPPKRNWYYGDRSKSSYYRMRRNVVNKFCEIYFEMKQKVEEF